MKTKKLSEVEIDYILSGIDDLIPKYLSTEIRTSYLLQFLEPLRTQLRQVDLIEHENALSYLRKKVHQRVSRSIIQPGESVGILCAQSIGERQTQLTLNSFHQSGLAVATVVTGVPRFLELLNATKDPKMPSLRFQIRPHSKKPMATPRDIRNILSHNIVSITLDDIILRNTVHQEKENEIWYDAFEIVYSNQFREYKACLSLTIDIQKIYLYKLSFYTIAQAIEKQFSDVCCVFSPLHIGQIDIFVDTSQVVLPSGTSFPSFLNEKTYIHIYLEDVVKPKILETTLCGLPGITGYHIVKDMNDTNKFFIETNGTNLYGVLSLSYVDIATVSSNNMWDIYHVMGIEATREFLIEEFTRVVSSDGTFINPVHILLLVDIMTHHGIIYSVSRYGLKNEHVGVLSRSSFEESLDHFCQAGFYSEKEPIKAVSAAIMCGKRSKIGSGLCTLLMDWEKIQRLSHQK